MRGMCSLILLGMQTLTELIVYGDFPRDLRSLVFDLIRLLPTLTPMTNDKFAAFGSVSTYGIEICAISLAIQDPPIGQDIP